VSDELLADVAISLAAQPPGAGREAFQLRRAGEVSFALWMPEEEEGEEEQVVVEGVTEGVALPQSASRDGVRWPIWRRHPSVSSARFGSPGPRRPHGCLDPARTRPRFLIVTLGCNELAGIHPNDETILNGVRFGEDIAMLRGQEDWDHSGQHRRNVQRICEHVDREGANTMSKMLRWINRELVDMAKRQHGGADGFLGYLEILCFCKSGRDRSVGISTFLECALMSKGWCGETHHLCKPTWRPNRGCRIARARNRGVCPMCQPEASAAIVRDLFTQTGLDLGVRAFQ